MYGSLSEDEIGPAQLSQIAGVSHGNAVVARGVYKSYGTSRRPIPVLQDLEMTVPKGAIYGLLGPSGCGKTTLLRCIVGRLPLDDGHIFSLGKKPGSRGHQVPGCMVGYMPQELALYNEFTIGETLAYFGRLHKMKSSTVAERTKFLIDFLHLPEKGRLISKLSGGQQRRTSFAIALLQEPQLLILDEPTVGVDPLLRQRIWEHLLYIAQHSQCTIIITTHYVEEARQAHVVGLMRSGRLLAEAPPLQLIETHNKQTLEDVFLALCEHDQVGDIEVEDTHSAAADSDVVRRKPVNNKRPLPPTDSEDAPLLSSTNSVAFENVWDPPMTRFNKFKSWLPSFRNIIALAIKNFIVLRRQIGFLLFEFFLPAFQIILFCTCVGREPFDLGMAIVNKEVNCSTNWTLSPIPASCAFLTFINNRTIIQQNFSNRFDDARQSVIDGRNWGVLEMKENFTTDLFARMNPSSSPDNATIDGGSVHLYLDMTNQQITYTIQAEILAAFQKYIDYALTSLGKNPAVAEIPVKIEDAIYGELHPSFTNFMAPGIILSITFFMATGLTALAFVLERKQGLLDRSLVAGASPIEVMIGHICTQFLVMFIQVGILLTFALAVFHIPVKGPFILVLILTLLQGLTGMALGLLISTMSNEETSAIQLSLGSVYPNMLLSGIIWPLEAMPHWLRYISYCLPMTYAAEAMRGILARGWDMTFLPVWRGYLVTIAWGWGLMVISGIVLKLRKE